MQIDIDVTGDGQLGEYIEWLGRHHCKIVKLVPRGPGGGNPCLTVDGSFLGLKGLIEDDFYGATLYDVCSFTQHDFSMILESLCQTDVEAADIQGTTADPWMDTLLEHAISHIIINWELRAKKNAIENMAHDDADLKRDLVERTLKR